MCRGEDVKMYMIRSSADAFLRRTLRRRSRELPGQETPNSVCVRSINEGGDRGDGGGE